MTHYHQFLPWDYREVPNALEELHDHIGFPFGLNLRCPIFQQDKYRYVVAMNDDAIPTLKIDIYPYLIVTDPSPRVQAVASTSKILSFMERHPGYQGWVLKLPFCTMSKGLKFATTMDQVLQRLALIIREYGESVPYVMLQPKLANRQEYKVVVLNGEAKYYTNCGHGVSIFFVLVSLYFFPSSLFIFAYRFSAGPKACIRNRERGATLCRESISKNVSKFRRCVSFDIPCAC
jgi:hypothetical protein